MSRRRLRGALALVLLILFLAGGCPRKAPRKPVLPLKIGLCVADAARDGNTVIRRVFQEKARAEKVRIIFADAQNDPARQERELERLVKKERVKAVVVQFVDPAAAGGMVRRLREAGVKVVALETLVPDAPLDAYIASDHARAGELLGRFVVESLPGGGASPARVLFLGGDPGDPGMAAVGAAFRGVLGAYPAVAVTVENVPRSDPRAVGPLVTGTLDRYGNAVDAVAAADSRFAVAAVEVLRARGLVGRVVTAGVGADRRATDLMSARQHGAEVDVQPEMLGTAALRAAVDLVRRGEWAYETRVATGDFSIPAQIVPVRLIRPANLYLLTERWRKYGGGAGPDKGSSRSEGAGGGGAGKGGKKGAEKKTRLRVTTQDGRTVEIDVPGEVKKIETVK